MCKVISVSNQKGGVGKTVTCVNLGIGLAREGRRVLLIDADPQGSLTISLGCQEPDKLEYCKRLINTRSKYTNYSVPIKVGLEHFTPAYWKSGALFRALAFHRSILSFLTRA